MYSQLIARILLAALLPPGRQARYRSPAEANDNQHNNMQLCKPIFLTTEWDCVLPDMTVLINSSDIRTPQNFCPYSGQRGIEHPTNKHRYRPRKLTQPITTLAPEMTKQRPYKMPAACSKPPSFRFGRR